jgi:hypothetical protein
MLRLAEVTSAMIGSVRSTIPWSPSTSRWPSRRKIWPLRVSFSVSLAVRSKLTVAAAIFSTSF